MKNFLRTSFMSLTRNEALARGVAAQFCLLFDPTVEELSDVRTAVSEAVTNAVIHGYGASGGTEGRRVSRSRQWRRRLRLLAHDEEERVAAYLSE